MREASGDGGGELVTACERTNSGKTGGVTYKTLMKCDNADRR